MAVDGFGAAADHAALSGLTVGDPHPQYTITLQGLAAARPAQPVKQGTRYVASDTAEESISTGSSWITLPLNKEYVSYYVAADANVAPRSYPEGVSRSYFAQGTAGFPAGAYWSVVETIRFGNDVRQTAYEVDTSARVYARTANSAANSWYSWVVQAEDTGWKTPTMQNGWVEYSGSYPIRYRRINGVIHLKGLLKNGSIQNTAFNLPAGYRPAHTLHFPAHTHNGTTYTHGFFFVSFDGNVVPYFGGTTSSASCATPRSVPTSIRWSHPSSRTGVRSSGRGSTAPCCSTSRTTWSTSTSRARTR